jgi:hypothetical protein
LSQEKEKPEIAQSKDIEPDEAIVLSSGPIEATVDTEIISVNILNIGQDHAREVIIEILDWTTSPPRELGKFVFLCGEAIDPCDIGYCDEDENGSGFDPTIFPAEDSDIFLPILEPVFFIIPAKMQLTVLAEFPQETILSSNPCYEVRIYLKKPTNVLVSSYGLDLEFEKQAGTTVLNNQFYPPKPIQLQFPDYQYKNKQD